MIWVVGAIVLFLIVWAIFALIPEPIEGFENGAKWSEKDLTFLFSIANDRFYYKGSTLYRVWWETAWRREWVTKDWLRSRVEQAYRSRDITADKAVEITEKINGLSS